MEKMKNKKMWNGVCRMGLLQRVSVLLLSAALALPAQVYAHEETAAGSLTEEKDICLPEAGQEKSQNRVEQELHHIHIGSEEEGGGCYTEDVLHVHEGNPTEGGICYGEAVYHQHTGNESDGEGCYGEKKYHVHEGSEAKGGACYGEAVYHSHAGNSSKGGGCYGTAVYHVHSGTAAKGGGCYGKAVHHSHSGSAAKGGGCYGKAVYHSHTGSASSGGGCYKTPVYHTHVGNSSSGGACYWEKYHVHTDACYTTEVCIATYEGGFQRIAEYDEECYHHGMTLHMTFEGTYEHQSCGLGRVTDSKTICWACNKMDIDHEYQKLICGKDERTIEGYELSCGKGTDTVDAWRPGCNQDEKTVIGYEINCGKNTSTVDSYQLNCGKNEKSVESYRLNCGKTEKTVESYRQNCGKTEETVDSYIRNCEKDETVIDAYALSCRKTEETVDGHSLGCGRNEDTVYAVFSLSNMSDGWSGSPVVLQAACEDKDGFLHLEEAVFSWEDGSGDMAENVTVQDDNETVMDDNETVRDDNETAGEDNETAGEDKWEGTSVSCNRMVTENGIYTVRLLVKNEDVAEKEAVLSLEVKNIDHTAPVIKEVRYSTETEAAENEIRVTAEDIQPDGSAGSGLAQKAYSFDGGKTWEKESVYVVKENGTVHIMVRDLCGNRAEKSVDISNIRKKEDTSNPEDGKGGGDTSDPEDGKGGGDISDPEDGKGGENDSDSKDGNGGEGDSDSDDGNSGEGGAGSDGGSDGESDSDSDNERGSGDDSGSQDGDGEEGSDGSNGAEGGRSDNRKAEEKTQDKQEEKNGEAAEGKKEPQTVRPVISKKAEDMKEEKKEPEKKEEMKRPEKKETVVKQPEVKAASDSEIKPETVKKKEVAAPVVKAVTYTVSSVAFAAVLLYLLYMMFRSIRVYHQDGKGVSHYAGSCMLKKTENGFEVKLPDMLVEQSATGQFILRPGSVFASHHKGEELLILTGKRKDAVWIDKEIPFRLTVFA